MQFVLVVFPPFAPAFVFLLGFCCCCCNYCVLIDPTCFVASVGQRSMGVHIQCCSETALERALQRNAMFWRFFTAFEWPLQSVALELLWGAATGMLRCCDRSNYFEILSRFLPFLLFLAFLPFLALLPVFKKAAEFSCSEIAPEQPLDCPVTGTKANLS